LSRWSPSFRDLTSSVFRSSISINLRFKDYNYAFSVVGIYGLYADRVPFWEDLKNVGAFSGPFLVVGGDLNFSLSLQEVWGENPKEYQLRGFFHSFLEEQHLLYMEPVKLTPTWRNFRTGKEVVAKILDMFMVSEALLEMGIITKSSVVEGGSPTIALLSSI